MIYFEHKCPNCRNTEYFQAFSVQEYEPIPPSELKPGRPRVTAKMRTDNDPVKGYACASCPRCKQPVLFVFTGAMQDIKQLEAADKKPLRGMANNVKMINAYPETPQPYKHEAIPEPAKTLFADLQEILAEGKTPAITMGGCRSVLEDALKHLGAKGKTPYEKINDLLKMGIITKLIADWGHLIRFNCNFAIHEIKATTEEAEEMVDFMKIFLEYTFVLPWQIERFRQ